MNALASMSVYNELRVRGDAKKKMVIDLVLKEQIV